MNVYFSITYEIKLIKSGGADQTVVSTTPQNNIGNDYAEECLFVIVIHIWYLSHFNFTTII